MSLKAASNQVPVAPSALQEGLNYLQCSVEINAKLVDELVLKLAPIIIKQSEEEYGKVKELAQRVGSEISNKIYHEANDIQKINVILEQLIKKIDL